MEEPGPQDEAPRPEQRNCRLRQAAIMLFVLGLILLAARLTHRTLLNKGSECGGVRICEKEAFRKMCEEAAGYPEIESLLAVLGNPAEERCPEGAASCEVEVLGGKGPLFDGCIVEYEKGTGKILKSRWYGF